MKGVQVEEIYDLQSKVQRYVTQGTNSVQGTATIISTISKFELVSELSDVT